MNNVVPIYYCSFCGKDADKVEFIFTAHKADPRSPAICSECVDLTTKKLAEKRLEVPTESKDAAP